ncbi:hypothetical protein [Celeribacter sp.]|uniref:hypothetical protein n=1 Tax=Celeribacter sp. TaxID=1890673 RepID=UPI003A94B922
MPDEKPLSSASMEQSITYRAEALAALMRDRLGIRAGSDFASKLAKAGRRLPRWARRDGQLIVDAIALESHPKLSRQIDRKRVERALSNLAKYLGAVDPWQRRKGKILDVITAVAFVIFVVVGLVLGVMLWRGLI